MTSSLPRKASSAASLPHGYDEPVVAMALRALHDRLETTKDGERYDQRERDGVTYEDLASYNSE